MGGHACLRPLERSNCCASSPIATLPTSCLVLHACVLCAGDHSVALEALQVFEWELLGSALSCYNQLLGTRGGSSGGLGHLGGSGSLGPAVTGGALAVPAVAPTSLEGRLSEKGVVQLLMDVRFLRDVLVGGKPLTPRPVTAPAVSADGGMPAAAAHAPLTLDPHDPLVLSALAERKRMGLSLEQQLQVGQEGLLHAGPSGPVHRVILQSLHPCCCVPLSPWPNMRHFGYKLSHHM